MGICVYASSIFLAMDKKLKIGITIAEKWNHLILSAQFVKNEYVLNLKIFQNIIT